MALFAPAAFFLVALLLAASIAAGFGFLRMFGMWLNREITGSELLVWGFMYLAAFTMAIASRGTPLAFPMAFLCIILAIGYPVLNYLIELRGRQRMRTNDIAAYSQAAEKHPHNPRPLRRLGDIFMASADYALAAKYYARYLEKVRDGQVKAKLERCKRLQKESQEKTKICPACGTMNPTGVTHCIQCSEVLPGLSELLEPFRGHKGRAILVWTAGLAMGICLLLTLLQLFAKRFFPVLSYIVVPFLFLIAVTAFFTYLYVRLWR